MFKKQYCFLLLAFVASPAMLSADVFVGNTSWSFSPNPGIELDVTIDTDTDMVDIIMTGRTDGWYGVGFGNNVMLNTYGIVVYQDGTYDERRLDYSGGTVLGSSLTLVSSSVSGSERTSHFQRNRIGISGDHYTFQNTAGLMDLIGASDAGVFSYHGGTNRSPNSVMLNAIPEPSAVFVLTGLTLGMIVRRR